MLLRLRLDVLLLHLLLVLLPLRLAPLHLAELALLGRHLRLGKTALHHLLSEGSRVEPERLDRLPCRRRVLERTHRSGFAGLGGSCLLLCRLEPIAGCRVDLKHPGRLGGGHHADLAVHHHLDFRRRVERGQGETGARLLRLGGGCYVRGRARCARCAVGWGSGYRIAAVSRCRGSCGIRDGRIRSARRGRNRIRHVSPQRLAAAPGGRFG